MTNKLRQLWNIEDELVEKHHVEFMKRRGVHSGNEVFQVFATPLESEFGKGGKDRSKIDRVSGGVGRRPSPSTGREELNPISRVSS